MGGVRRTKYQKINQSHLEKKFMRNMNRLHMLPFDVTPIDGNQKAERAKWVKTIM